MISKKGIAALLAVYFIVVAGVATLWGAVFYVAEHFIFKLW